MDFRIRHVSEPERLLLAWQAPDHLRDRYRWAVGELRRVSPSNFSFRYFEPQSLEFSRLNQGKSYSLLDALGYQGHPAFPISRTFAPAPNVMAPFLRRLPPRSRTDFETYRRNFLLSSNVNVSDFGLLGLTEAKLPSDGFSLVDPLDRHIDRCELLLEIAGYRYYAERLGDLRGMLGRVVELRAEPDNSHDPNAVVIGVAGQCAGYINRLQASAFLRWIGEDRVHASLARLNGTFDKPRAFIFVQVRPAPGVRAA